MKSQKVVRWTKLHYMLFLCFVAFSLGYHPCLASELVVGSTVNSKSGSSYLILSELGAGSLGTVFRVKITRGHDLGREVALKVITSFSTAPEDFRIELLNRLNPFIKDIFNEPPGVLLKIQEPEIIQTLDSDGDTEEWVAIRTEIVEGNILAANIRESLSIESIHAKNDPSSFGERIANLNQLMTSLIAGMNEMIGVGRVHCDIKPLNIFYRNGKKGFEYLLGDLDSNAPAIERSLTRTLLFSAPEYAIDASASSMSDIFSAALTLYFMAFNVNPLAQASSELRLPPMQLAFQKDFQDRFAEIVKNRLAGFKSEINYLNQRDRQSAINIYHFLNSALQADPDQRLTRLYSVNKDLHLKLDSIVVAYSLSNPCDRLFYNFDPQRHRDSTL